MKTYHVYTYERGSLVTVLVEAETLADSDGITDFIVSPDTIKNLNHDGTVDIDFDGYLPDYMEGQ